MPADWMPEIPGMPTRILELPTVLASVIVFPQDLKHGPSPASFVAHQPFKTLLIDRPTLNQQTRNLPVHALAGCWGLLHEAVVPASLITAPVAFHKPFRRLGWLFSGPSSRGRHSSRACSRCGDPCRRPPQPPWPGRNRNRSWPDPTGGFRPCLATPCARVVFERPAALLPVALAAIAATTAPLLAIALLALALPAAVGDLVLPELICPALCRASGIERYWNDAS